MWQVGGVLFLSLKMSQNSIDDVLVLDAGDDPDRTTAAATNLDRAAFGSILNTRFSGASHDAGPRSYPIKRGSLGHATCAATRAKSPLLAGEPRGRPGQSLEVAFVAAYPEKAMLETTALQVGLEFPVYMVRQRFALLGQLVHQGRVVRLDELIERC